MVFPPVAEMMDFHLVLHVDSNLDTNMIIKSSFNYFNVDLFYLHEEEF